MLQIIQRAWIWIRPTVKVFFVVSGDRPKLRLLPAGGDDELIVVEQRSTSLPLSSALFTVAHDLVNRLRNRFLYFGRFTLDHHHWQTVKEKHNIRDNVMLSSKNAHLELAHNDEAVTSPLFEVDKLYRRTLFTCLAILADTGVFQ